MFKENGASVGQPSTAWGWVLNDDKNSVSREASLKNRTSVPTPSGPLRAHGWVLSVGTGLTPQTPPNLLVMFLLLVLSESFSHAEGGRRINICSALLWKLSSIVKNFSKTIETDQTVPGICFGTAKTS